MRDLMIMMNEASLNLIKYFIEFKMLDYVDSAVLQLKICIDELMYQLKSDHCQYICRVDKNMQTHCKQKHD